MICIFLQDLFKDPSYFWKEGNISSLSHCKKPLDEIVKNPESGKGYCLSSDNQSEEDLISFGRNSDGVFFGDL